MKMKTEMKNRSHRRYIKKPRPKHLSKMCSSVHEKVKQH